MLCLRHTIEIGLPERKHLRLAWRLPVSYPCEETRGPRLPIIQQAAGLLAAAALLCACEAFIPRSAPPPGNAETVRASADPLLLLPQAGSSALRSAQQGGLRPALPSGPPRDGEAPSSTAALHAPSKGAPADTAALIAPADIRPSLPPGPEIRMVAAVAPTDAASLRTSGRPLRPPVRGQSCECPFDLDAEGRRCGAASSWSRPGASGSACYADRWGETARSPCSDTGSQAFGPALRFCPTILGSRQLPP